jgi:hypothetical protein
MRTPRVVRVSQLSASEDTTVAISLAAILKDIHGIHQNRCPWRGRGGLSLATKVCKTESQRFLQVSRASEPPLLQIDLTFVRVFWHKGKRHGSGQIRLISPRLDRQAGT